MAVQASVNYHVKSAEPQAFVFEADGVEGRLDAPELVPTNITARDVRGAAQQFRFDTDGIVFVQHSSGIATFDSQADWQQTYDREIEALLKQQLAAKEVVIFDHTVRIDDPEAVRRPARNVHNDYNKAGAEQRLIDIVGEQRVQDFHAGGFAFVNVWRPIKNTIRSSPLGFINPRSMSTDDWMDIGLVYPDRFGQILGVAENDHHEWFYQSEMTPDEVVIFNIYDSTGRPHLAHSALDLPGDDKVAVPRMSIETRTLVRFG